MPGVIEGGIGTWYYGKKRIHTIRGECEVCRKQADLLSYDTTLFFVIAFIPLIPLQKRRIIRQCALCKCHRVLSFKKWEEAKAHDGADLMEKLQADPHNRDTILQAIGYSQAYQDEPLFNRVAETLASEHSGDAAVQVQLGNAFSYFAHWPRAEEAYRAALTVEENEAVREQLALTLLKQDRPDEARDYLQHVIDDKKRDCAGMIYFLIKGYQAQGRHEEALALMDERDKAFPEFVNEKEYKEQRKTSIRYQHTDRKVGSAFLTDGKAGYREGSSRMPRLIAALVVLGLIGLYFGSAIWMGQSRKVYLVNGTGQAYTVLVQGTEHSLPANYAFAVHVEEGDVGVVFKEPGLELPPIQCQIETPFWTRPFESHTFVINPDQSALIAEEEVFYAQANAPPGSAKVHVGKPFYSMESIDYEFENFPPTLTVKGGGQVRKTRVGLSPHSSAETRIQMAATLDNKEQIELCKRVLKLDPGGTLFLSWLAVLVPPDEVIAFVEPRLDDRPIRVEWHRMYQQQMERLHPETDLRIRYRKLLADSKKNADALYLLGNVEPDRDESDKLFRQAATADPPSGHALSTLGVRALCEANFAEAANSLEKALPRLADNTITRETLYNALLANGEYDRLLKLLQTDAAAPGRKITANEQMIRMFAVRGDKVKARQILAETVQASLSQQRQFIQKALEWTLFCAENDAENYLKSLGESTVIFQAKFLRGSLKEAAALAASSGFELSICHGLVYLQAMQTGDKKLADSEWDELLRALAAGNRDEKALGEILAGRKPLVEETARRAAIDPNVKRVLLAVLAQRYPKKSGNLLALAKKLDFHRDAISLCLAKVWQGR